MKNRECLHGSWLRMESEIASTIISLSEELMHMESELLQKLGDKSITPMILLQTVKRDVTILPELIRGVSSSKARIRYGCAKVLMDLSEQSPEKLYPYMDFFTDLLDSKFRILTWNAIAIIANLTKVDGDKKFDAIFSKYYALLNDQYMVTVASIVGHSGKIALAKPYLAQKIADELLKVESLSTTPHLTEECKKVIAEKAIDSLDLFFDQIENKGEVVSFARRHLNSPRKTLKLASEKFLQKQKQ